MPEQLAFDWRTPAVGPPLRRAYRYRLAPTVAQAQALDAERRGACRLYNAALQERIQGYRFGRKVVRPGPHPNHTTQSRQIKAIQADGHLGVSHTDIAYEILDRVDKTFRAFFRRRHEGQGFPLYRAVRRFESFTYRREGPSCRVRDNGRLYVGGVGEVRVQWHRPLEGQINTITFKTDGRHWDVIFSCEVRRLTLPPSDAVVGLDVGLESFATFDTGETIPNPRFLAMAEHQIRLAQRRVARRQKGSQRRRKAVEQLRRVHGHIARQRAAFQHQEARKLVNRFGTIIVEDLNVKGLARGMLAGPVADAAWGGFVQKVGEKVEETARDLRAVNPAGTSQVCPCGEPVPKDLKDRWHHCPACGLSVPRDQASGMEIKRRGMAR